MIREATIKDLDEINSLGLLLNSNFNSLFHLETEFTKDIAIVLVYVENGQVKGFLYALDVIDNIDLLSIVVSTDSRGKKIGTKLMEYLINNYSQDKSITLEVSVDNPEAIGLYKKLNFSIVNTRKSYYNGIDAYLMRRDN